MADVVQFPQGGRLDRQRARRLLQEAAENSERLIYIIEFDEGQEWYRLVTTGQVQRCLREGEIITDPTLDENGNWCCLLYRLCGGVRVYVSVALQLNVDRTLECAYVVDVNNRIPV